MGESWKDKTVSLGNVDKEEFDSELAHITVSENGIKTDFKDVEDWKRIKREIGEESILKEVPWEEVEGIETNVEHLYYPHVDVKTDEGTKRLYFTEDEVDTLHECFNAIQKFWNFYRESGSRSRNTYSYEDSSGTGEEQEDEESESGEEEGGKEDDESVEDVVEGFVEG